MIFEYKQFNEEVQQSVFLSFTNHPAVSRHFCIVNAIDRPNRNQDRQPNREINSLSEDNSLCQSYQVDIADEGCV